MYLNDVETTLHFETWDGQWMPHADTFSNPSLQIVVGESLEVVLMQLRVVINDLGPSQKRKAES